jgi:23S rRNA pseudouridine2605 synthase
MCKFTKLPDWNGPTPPEPRGQGYGRGRGRGRGNGRASNGRGRGARGGGRGRGGFSRPAGDDADGQYDNGYAPDHAGPSNGQSGTRDWSTGISWD